MNQHQQKDAFSPCDIYIYITKVTTRNIHNHSLSPSQLTNNFHKKNKKYK